MAWQGYRLIADRWPSCESRSASVWQLPVILAVASHFRPTKIGPLPFPLKRACRRLRCSEIDNRFDSPFGQGVMDSPQLLDDYCRLLAEYRSSRKQDHQHRLFAFLDSLSVSSLVAVVGAGTATEQAAARELLTLCLNRCLVRHFDSQQSSSRRPFAALAGVTLNDIAFVYFGESFDDQTRETAERVLYHLIEREARFIATQKFASWTGSRIDRACEDLPFEVMRHLNRYDSRRPFSPWCRAIIHKKLVSWVTRRKVDPADGIRVSTNSGADTTTTESETTIPKTRKRIESAADVESVWDQHANQPDSRSAVPLSERDWRTIDGWPPRVARVLVIRGGLTMALTTERREELFGCPIQDLADDPSVLLSKDHATIWMRDRFRLFEELEHLRHWIAWPPIGLVFYPALFAEARTKTDALTAKDMKTFGTLRKPWPDRVLAVAMAGLWRRVEAAGVWSSWLQPLGLSPDFPPPELREAIAEEDRMLKGVDDESKVTPNMLDNLARLQQHKLDVIRGHLSQVRATTKKPRKCDQLLTTWNSARQRLAELPSLSNLIRWRTP